MHALTCAHRYNKQDTEMCVMLAHSALAHASVPALGVQTPDTHSLWRPHKPTVDSTQSPTQASAAVQVCHLPAATGRPHVRSRGLWGGGQVSRQQAMLPGLASSPGFQNDPPHTLPSLLRAPPARTRRPSAWCPLLGCRQSPWRRLAHLDSAPSVQHCPACLPHLLGNRCS